MGNGIEPHQLEVSTGQSTHLLDLLLIFLPGFCYETLPWLVGIVLKPQDGLAIGPS